jgi:hypothetical protein
LEGKDIAKEKTFWNFARENKTTITTHFLFLQQQHKHFHHHHHQRNNKQNKQNKTYFLKLISFT